MNELDRSAFEKWVANPHMLNRNDEPGFQHLYEHPWTAGACAGWQEAAKRQQQKDEKK